jgi:ATP-dependent Clp protease ATP-binding subunit ClpB
VTNTLLQVLDDGRLTDAQGRTVDFRHSIVIMTSNLGSQEITEGDGAWPSVRARVLAAVRAHFRPEFLNRIDEIVVFRPLQRDQVEGIVDMQLEDLRGRLAARRVALVLTPQARALLAEEGFDPTYGARPLRRAVQRLVIQPLALRLLQGELPEGETVTVDAEDGRIALRVGQAAGPRP